MRSTHRTKFRVAKFRVALTALWGAAALVWAGTVSAGVSVPQPDDRQDFEFTVNATVVKSKDTVVIETIERRKDIRIDVVTMQVASQFSEALAVLSQANTNFSNGAGTDRSADLSSASNDGAGMAVVNQATGNANNQGSSSSLAAVQEPQQTVFAEAQAAVGQSNGGVPLQGDGEEGPPVASLTAYVEAVLADNASSRSATATDSINGNNGMTHVNQSVGDANNQGNASALTISLSSGGVVLSDAALGQSNMAVLVSQFAVQRTATIMGSISANSGITGVNQAAGNFANQANVVANGLAIVN